MMSFIPKKNVILFLPLFTLLSSSLPAQNAVQNQIIEEITTVSSQQEYIYIHTDRNYYNTGEDISFKVYLTNEALSLTGAKSKVVYVDLINQENEVLDRKKIAIKDGIGIGAFKLNRYFLRGKYLIRSYTKVLQIDEISFYRKTVFINSFNGDQKELTTFSSVVEDENKVAEDIFGKDQVYVDISAKKESYNKNEKATLLLELYDKEGEPIFANCSVAIVDQQYLVNFSTSNDIGSYLSTASNLKTSSPASLTQLEEGLSIEGYITEKGNVDKPIVAIGYLSTLQQDFSMHPFETDEQGHFSIKNLDFEGEVDFFIQAAKKNKKNKNKKQAIDKMVLAGNRNVDIHLIEEPLPAIQQDSIFLSKSKPIFIQAAMPEPIALQQDTLNVWDGSLSLNLEEVTVTAEKINKIIAHYEDGMLYKNPDERITTESLPLEQYTDVYSILKGRVSGMELARPETAGHKKSIILRGRSTGLAGAAIKMDNGARFMVNGAFVHHTYAESIPPQNIAFVDVVKSLSKLNVYGELGVNGLIMIYLKPPATQTRRKTTIDGVLNFKIKGYDKGENIEKTFAATEKYAPTIYWNPIVQTNDLGEASIEFYTPNRAGVYEVFLEGMSDKGVPITLKTKIIIE